jgi:hypothetical protein
MTNDVLKLNAIVDDLGHKMAELAELGRDGFKAPLVTVPAEFTEMTGLPVGPWQPLSNDLIWFYALKITIYARQMLEEAGRIFQQMEDETSVQKVQNILAAIDGQLQPSETAFQVYGRLLHHTPGNGANGKLPHRS